PDTLAPPHDVRRDALVLDGEHLSRAPEAGDHFVADEQRPELVGQVPEQLQVARWGHDVARRALNRLDDDRRDVLRGFELDLPAQEIDAVPLVRRERLVEGAARAGG